VKAATRVQRERVLSASHLKEGERLVAEIDAALEKGNDAELPFLKGIEVLELSEALETVEALEKSASEAQAAIADARTFLASKTIELKRFADAVSKPVLEDFGKLTERINQSASRLAQFIKDTEGRKRNTLMQQAEEKLVAAEADVKLTAEAAGPLAEADLEKLSAEEAGAICEKLASLEKAAQTKVEEARKFINERKRDVGTSKGGAGDKTVTEQLAKLQTRLSSVTQDLSKAKKTASEHEQKFVARKLILEATDMLKDAEREIEKAEEVAAPLLVEGGQHFLAATLAQILASNLKDYMRAKSITRDGLFQQINGGTASEHITEEVFMAFLVALPETLGKEEVTYSEEQRKTLFKRADSNGDGKVSKGEFEELFRERFMCVKSISVTDSFEISSSKTVCKLELDTIVEAMGESKKHESSGMERVECLLVDSGDKGWVTMKGNQGTNYLEPYSQYTAFSKLMTRTLEATSKTATKASQFVKGKEAELKSCTKGPLAEAKSELAKLRPQVVSAQSKLEKLRKKVSEAKKEHAAKEEAEKKAQQDVRDQKAATAIMKSVDEKVEEFEKEAKRLEELVAPLTKVVEDQEKLLAFETPATVLLEAEQAVAVVSAAAVVARDLIAAQQKALGTLPTRGPMLNTRQTLVKTKAKVDSVDKSATASVEVVRKACSSLSTARLISIAEAFREEIQKRGITPEQLFDELATGDSVPEDAFCTRICGFAGLDISREQATIVYRHVEKARLKSKSPGEGGVGRRNFLRLVQQYFACIKEIAITTEFEIGKGKTIRKLEAKEVVRVLEGPRQDAKLGVTRVHAISVSDGVSGWVSVKGNQGTPFLKETEKPFLACALEVRMESTFANAEDTELVRLLKEDEVVEILEGPRKVDTHAALRAKGKAGKDGATGWFTIRDRGSVELARADGGMYVCTTPIAMTDNLDIKASKVLRKLELHESVKLLEGPLPDGATGVTRIKAKSMKDGTEAWITVKGNAGTVYAEESKKIYTVLKEGGTLQKKFDIEGSETVRELEKDETIEITEGPKEEKVTEVKRVKGRTLSTPAVEGWMTFAEKSLKPWSPVYKCLASTPLSETMTIKDGATVRKLEKDELLELLEGPMEETSINVMRIKGRCKGDGAVGWATIKGNQGTAFLAAQAPK